MSTLKVDTIQGKTTAGTVAMPSNYIVQKKVHAWTTETSSTSSSHVDITGSSFSFTPLFSNSVLHIRFDVQCNIYRESASGQGMALKLNADGTNVANAPQYNYEMYMRNFSGGTHDLYIPYSKEYTLTVTNTNAKTIKLTGAVYGTGDNGRFRVNGGGYFQSTISVLEVKA